MQELLIQSLEIDWNEIDARDSCGTSAQETGVP